MAIKRVCDRCGKNITRVLVPSTISVHSIITTKYDICSDCYLELLEWLKEKEVKENEKS